MTIDQTKEGTRLTVAIGGRLDTTTAPQMDEEIKPAMEGITDLIIDMKDLDYVSSAGLRVLLSCQKIMNKQGSMLIKNVNDDIMEIFEVTGFVDILNIENA